MFPVNETMNGQSRDQQLFGRFIIEYSIVQGGTDMGSGALMFEAQVIWGDVNLGDTKCQ